MLLCASQATCTYWFSLDNLPKLLNSLLNHKTLLKKLHSTYKYSNTPIQLINFMANIQCSHCIKFSFLLYYFSVIHLKPSQWTARDRRDLWHHAHKTQDQIQWYKWHHLPFQCCNHKTHIVCVLCAGLLYLCCMCSIMITTEEHLLITRCILLYL